MEKIKEKVDVTFSAPTAEDLIGMCELMGFFTHVIKSGEDLTITGKSTYSIPNDQVINMYKILRECGFASWDSKATDQYIKDLEEAKKYL